MKLKSMGLALLFSMSFSALASKDHGKMSVDVNHLGLLKNDDYAESFNFSKKDLQTADILSLIELEQESKQEVFKNLDVWVNYTFGIFGTENRATVLKEVDGKIVREEIGQNLKTYILNSRAARIMNYELGNDGLKLNVAFSPKYTEKKYLFQFTNESEDIFCLSRMPKEVVQESDNRTYLLKQGDYQISIIHNNLIIGALDLVGFLDINRPDVFKGPRVCLTVDKSKLNKVIEHSDAYEGF